MQLVQIREAQEATLPGTSFGKKLTPDLRRNAGMTPESLYCQAWLRNLLLHVSEEVLPGNLGNFVGAERIGVHRRTLKPSLNSRSTVQTPTCKLCSSPGKRYLEVGTQICHICALGLGVVHRFDELHQQSQKTVPK